MTLIRAISGLALIYGIRMFGLFAVLPVLAVYSQSEWGASGLMIGLAFGIYGLTQGGLQMPMGWLSDHYGRKRIISIGLIAFILGSLLCAEADSMWQLIFGRALQGAGAIGACMTALLSDMVPLTKRAKAMACVGISIGLSFLLALWWGPGLSAFIGVSGVFYILAGAGALGLLILWFWVPSEELNSLDEKCEPHGSRVSVSTLTPLFISIAALHALLSLVFMALPLTLIDNVALPIEKHGWFYLIAMIGALAFGWPFLGHRLSLRWQNRLLPMCISVMAIGLLMLQREWHSLFVLGVAISLFFLGFTILEAKLPTWVSQLAPSHQRGYYLGWFSTSQFLGAFFGGVIGGTVIDLFGLGGMFALAFGLTALWLCLVANFKPPVLTTTKLQARGMAQP